MKCQFHATLGFTTLVTILSVEAPSVVVDGGLVDMYTGLLKLILNTPGLFLPDLKITLELLEY